MAETYEYLTDEDKDSIIENHLRNLEYALFNTEMSIVAANSVASPDATVLTNLNNDLSDIRTKIAALKAI
jgi:hypothetical protein